MLWDGCIFAGHKIMMNISFTLFTGLLFLVCGFQPMKAQDFVINNEQQAKARDTKNIVYFNPEIAPNVAEIRDATYDSFFSAVSDRFADLKNKRMVRVDMPVVYGNTDHETVKEICKNNDAGYAVIPQVKFFKVGIGQFVFSSQVVVSMKLYDAQGNFISESSYDTFRKNARILGSAQNSIKIGTDGALKLLMKDLRKLK